MRYNKIIHNSIPIKDPVGLCTDFEGNILAMLRKSYRGRNYAGVFIYDIISIIAESVSDIVITTEGSDVGATVELDMVADVEEFTPGEIITDAKISKIVPGSKDIFGQTFGRLNTPISTVLVSSAEAAEAKTRTVDIEPLVSLLRAGNVIPLRIIDVKNEILFERPVLSGTIYVPFFKKVPPLIGFYNGKKAASANNLITDEIKKYESLAADIKNNKDTAVAIQVQSFTYMFEAILKGSEGVKKVNISGQEDTLEKGYYCKNWQCKFMEPEIIYLGATLPEEFSGPNANKIIPSGPSSIFDIFRFEYLQELRFFCGFVENYPDNAKLKENNAIWKFYVSLT